MIELDKDYWLDCVLTQLSVEMDDSGMNEEEFETAVRIAVYAEIDSAIATYEDGDDFDYQLFESNIFNSARTAVGLK